jgi:hypothetical protein
VREGFGKEIKINLMEEPVECNMVLYLKMLLLGRIIYRDE